MNDEMSRRDFMKKTAVGAGAAATAALGTGCTKLRTEGPGQENQAAEKKWGRGAGQWIPSCCNMCGGQSGIMCHVVDGKLTKIEPNHWNPNNYCSVSTTPSGDGFFDGYSEKTGTREGCVICPKGNAGIMQLYDPDRVKRPLKRTNPQKGDNEDPRWQEISWEQALDEIATKLAVMRNAGDAHKLLWWNPSSSRINSLTPSGPVR